MNAYQYHELEIGHTEFFYTEITNEKQHMFCQMSGDNNPLHTDPKFALKQGFQDCVVYGMLAGSFYSTLVGVYMPGENCLIHRMDMQFRKPVFIGDKLKIHGTIKEKYDHVQLLVIKACIYNQKQELVSRATIEVGCLK